MLFVGVEWMGMFVFCEVVVFVVFARFKLNCFPLPFLSFKKKNHFYFSQVWSGGLRIPVI